MRALLALEDGLVLWGRSFTGAGESSGEVVFNTAMTGYQEVLTDPSYKGQIVTMTYPLMGNYGVNPEDIESRGIHVEGFIVKEYHPYPSNWRSQGNLADYLKAAGKLGVEGLDTRAITKRLREVGAMRGIISTLDLDPASLVRRAQSRGELRPGVPREATLFLLDAVFDRFLQSVAVPALDVTLGLHQATDEAIHKHIRELVSLLQEGLMA